MTDIVSYCLALQKACIQANIPVPLGIILSPEDYDACIGDHPFCQIEGIEIRRKIPRDQGLDLTYRYS